MIQKLLIFVALNGNTPGGKNLFKTELAEDGNFSTKDTSTKDADTASKSTTPKERN